jgi:hypothetical protein
MLTGAAMPVCSDPLCSHDTDECLFYNINPSIAVVDNTIIYAKYKDESYTLYQYDIANDKVHILLEGIDFNELYSADNHIYFWNFYIEDNTRKIELIRYDLQSQSKDILATDDVVNLSYFLSYDNGQICWYDDFGNAFYTDLDYNKISECEVAGRYADGYYYVLEKNYTEADNYKHANSRKLIRINKEYNSQEVICEDLDEYYILGDKIIYLVSVENPEIAYQSPTDEDDVYYNNYNGKVYIMNADGSDPHVLCNNVGYNIYGLRISVTNNLIYNDYIGILLYEMVDDVYTISPNVLIVDTTTGEYIISNYTP